MAANQNQNQAQDDAQRPRISLVAHVLQQWQYGQEFDCSLARLSQLGLEGWELVGSPVTQAVLGTSGKLLYVFKRPIQVPQR
jgi:hypothetical protein